MTPVPRRAVLVLAAGLPVLAACTTPPKPPPPPDPLAELAEQARLDASAASAIAQAVPDLAAAAGEVAKARSAHALALQGEVDRERPPRSTAPSAPPASTTPPPAPPSDKAAAKTALLDALKAAEQKTGALVPTVPRYRAGLLGSVAAGCACLREVLA